MAISSVARRSYDLLMPELPVLTTQFTNTNLSRECAIPSLQPISELLPQGRVFGLKSKNNTHQHVCLLFSEEGGDNSTKTPMIHRRQITE